MQEDRTCYYNDEFCRFHGVTAEGDAIVEKPNGRMVIAPLNTIVMNDEEHAHITEQNAAYQNMIRQKEGSRDE